MAGSVAQLVERDRQLEALRAWWDESRTSGGRLVLVSGEAGAGKSALVDRLCDDLRLQARLLVGVCEPLATPAALGPLLDMAGELAPPVRALLDEPHDPARFRRAFLSELAATSGGALVVIEDAHWADEATLDLVRFVARRLGSLAAMLVVTYRTEDVGPHHPLRVLAGDLSSLAVVRRLAVPPLTLGGVRHLAQGTALDAAELHALTGGNPFFVSEVIAAGGGIPTSVHDAVLARAARLSAGARETLEAASCLGYRASATLIEQVAGHGHDAVDECIVAGMLVEIEGDLSFRHELAQAGVAASVPPGRVRRYNARALAALEKLDSDRAEPGRLAQHAERAGDGAALLHWAEAAAARAARMGAHREAAAHCRRALGAVEDQPDADRARLLEGLALQCYLSDQAEEARTSWQAAVAAWGREGEHRRRSQALVGLTHTTMLGPRWILEADGHSRDAIDVLGGLPPGPELALAYANRAKVLVLGFDNHEALTWAERATTLAHQVGAGLAGAYALMLSGVARAQLGDDAGWRDIDAGVHLARSNGWLDEAGVFYFWRYHTVVTRRRYDLADSHYQEALQFFLDHDQETWHEWLRSYRARVLFEQGQWDQAERIAADVQQRAPIDDGRKVIALLVLGRLAARRGDPDAAGLLAKAEAAMATAEPIIGWVTGPAGALAEAAWYQGARETIPALLATPYEVALEVREPWRLGELAFWLWRSGALPGHPSGAAAPYEHHVRGRWAEAAAAWRALGCPYEAAQALSDSDDPAVLRSALDAFDRLGAQPARDEAAARLRRAGVVSIPRAKRGRPAAGSALSVREAQVLAHLADGRRNAEIAEQMFLSERTVEHHVASVLRKLGARDRVEAGRHARRRGINVDAV